MLISLATTHEELSRYTSAQLAPYTYGAFNTGVIIKGTSTERIQAVAIRQSAVNMLGVANTAIAAVGLKSAAAHLFGVASISIETDYFPRNILASMMDYLPEFMSQSLSEQQKPQAVELRLLRSNIQDSLNQAFVKTATTKLSDYEEFYGVQTISGLPQDQRREQIVAKAVIPGVCTKQHLIDIASAYTNGQVEVMEDNVNGIVHIKFSSPHGIPANIAGAQATISQALPAHLTVAYEYTYNNYGQLSSYTHGHLAAYTYDQLREGNIT